MPGRFFLTSDASEIAGFLGVEAAAMGAIPPRFNVAPGQEVLVLRDGGRVDLMRWGIIPVGRVNARGRPVLETIINARSETLFGKSAFAGTGRAIVPANGWYEWTGKTRRKTAWRIAPRGGGLMGFAAIWDAWEAPGGKTLLQVATVTCEPSADVREIHHRMGVILMPDQFAGWLTGSEKEATALMQPFPDGGLQVEEAVGVDWEGA